jgi:hypothetical protein
MPSKYNKKRKSIKNINKENENEQEKQAVMVTRAKCRFYLFSALRNKDGHRGSGLVHFNGRNVPAWVSVSIIISDS